MNKKKPKQSVPDASAGSQQKIAHQSSDVLKQIVAQGASFSGPIPPPAILNEYNQITPGLAEKEAKHRHKIEHAALAADIADQDKLFSEARLGQLCGLVIGLAAIVAGAYTAVNGAQWPGSIIGGGGVIGLVSVFIYGRKHTDNPVSQENAK